MYPFKRLMIGLSLKDEDPNTLEYAAMIHCLSPSFGDCCAQKRKWQ